jgi:hypothetical protein
MTRPIATLWWSDREVEVDPDDVDGLARVISNALGDNSHDCRARTARQSCARRPARGSRSVRGASAHGVDGYREALGGAMSRLTTTMQCEGEA